MKPPIVLVTWEDATAPDATPWVDNKDHKYVPKIFTSVGFLLHDSKEGIIITGSWAEDQVGSRDQIPRGMIRKLVKLK